MTHVPKGLRKIYCPDLFDWAAAQESLITEHRVRWVAAKYRLPLATAQTIAAHVFFHGDRR